MLPPISLNVHHRDLPFDALAAILIISHALKSSWISKFYFQLFCWKGFPFCTPPSLGASAPADAIEGDGTSEGDKPELATGVSWLWVASGWELCGSPSGSGWLSLSESSLESYSSPSSSTVDEDLASPAKKTYYYILDKLMKWKILPAFATVIPVTKSRLRHWFFMYTNDNTAVPSFFPPYAPLPGLPRRRSPFDRKATWQCGMVWRVSSKDCQGLPYISEICDTTTPTPSQSFSLGLSIKQRSWNFTS